MAITVTEQKRLKFGNGYAWIGDVAFDDSYPTDGEAITIPLANIFDISFSGGNSGYQFEYDRTDKKIKVYTPVKVQAAHTHAVALDSGASAAGSAHTHTFTGTDAGLTPVIAEALTVTSDVGTLANLPGAILAIHGTVSAASTNFKVVADARTIGTGEVHVNYATGAITFYSTDDPTAVTVDYLKKAAVPTGTNANESSHTHASGTLADAASGTGGAITASAAAEVENDTNLSALTVRIIAFGY